MKSTSSQSNLPFNGHPNGHSDGSAVQFGCSAQELSELMELDRHDAACRIQEQYGGVKEICRHLKTSPTKGLSGSLTDLQIRTQTFGSNAPASLHVSQNFLPLLWNASWDLTLGILIATVVISFALSFIPRELSADNETVSTTDPASEWIELVAIFVIIFFMVLAIALIESFKQQWICAAGTEHVRKCTVVRGGVRVEIPTKEVVVGDICDISYGNILPAWGFLVHGNSLRVKECLPDGTIETVSKDSLTDPVLRSGSHVVSGSGRVLITKVGLNAELFKKLCISFNQKERKFSLKPRDSLHSDVLRPKLSFLEEDDSDVVFHLKRKSMLDSKIRSLTVHLCYAGMAGSVLLFTALILQLCLMTFVSGRGTSAVDFVHDCTRYLLLSAAVVVVIVPMRLPAGVVLVFAQTLKRMILEGNLVHHLGALENVSYVTDVIVNKTGSVTRNQMSVVQLFLGGHIYKIPFSYHDIPPDICSLLVRLVSLSRDCTIPVEQPSCENLGSRGDQHDWALLKFVLDCQSHKSVGELTPSDHFAWICPFDSTRKFSFKVISCEQGGFQLLIKGAADVVLSRCSWMLDADGSVCPFTSDDLANIVQTIVQPMSSAGLSTICFAIKNYSLVPRESEECSSPEPVWDDELNVMSNLTCVAIFGIEDPLRDEMPKSVRFCQKLGVAVRMVTGESVEAAECMALRCGIINDPYKSDVLDGKAFEAQIRRVPTGPIVPEYFNAVWHKLEVVARSTPENRFTLVRVVSEFLSRMECQVIACIGKDSADVPSLKRADVGFSMGNVGADVTREASDIILEHDSFSGVVRCIVWSRCIQDNVRKLLQFQLTSIAVTFLTVVIGVCVFKESPLQVTHLLWIKIILDLLAAVALSSEQPMEKFIDCRPYNKLESLFSRSVGKNVVLHSLYQINVVITLFFAGEYFIDMDGDYGRKHYRMSPKYTTVFNTCILMILFNEISARMLDGERNIFHQISCNYAFVGTWIGSFIVQVFIIQFGGSVFSTVSLTLEQWAWCLFFGIGDLIWCQLIAFLPNFGICERPFNCRNDLHDLEQNSKALWEVEDDNSFDDSHLGMMLWKHGLTRLQNQLRVARAFKNILETSSDFQSSQGSLPDPDLSSLRLPRQLQSFSTHNCFYPQLHHREPPDGRHNMPNFKSKSADDVLSDPWITAPSVRISNQAAVPLTLKPGGVDPYQIFSR